ncbi:MAG: anion permease [Candidatus Eremiobacteraeota bacterium]|nr:anion permease [Candidatus Eremiobacteraeota bacterium]
MTALLPFYLLGGIFLGWSIGSKDFANVFGTAVTSRMLRFWNAVVYASLFCMLGALLEGERGIETLSRLAPQNLQTAIISTVAAALTITILNVIRLPISTSQAVVGSIIGIGIMTGKAEFHGLGKIVLCWLGAPVGAAMIVVPLYLGLGKIYNSLHLNIFQRDALLRSSLIIVGCYASYAMGANVTANIAAVFVSSGLLTARAAALIGSLSIALGIATFSKGVMMMVGRGLIKLDAFSALVAVLAEALTVHFFAVIGVPVSTAHAIIGSILGIGFIRGFKALKVKNLVGILVAWGLAPLIACIFAMIIFFLSNLHYVKPS